MTFRRILVLLAAALALCAAVNSGSQTCPVSGAKAVITSVASCPNSNCKATTWTIQAPSANTGKVYVGSSTVTTAAGVYLNAGDSATSLSQANFAPYDLSQTYIACTVSGDTVTYNYFQ